MPIPNSTNFGTYLGTLGTTVLESQPGYLTRVVFAGTYVGSLEFYDSPTTTGTAAGNLLYNIGLPLLNQYREINLDSPFKRGLTVVATGTPIAAVVWQK